MISVIIPTLNDAPHLSRTLQALIAGMTGGIVKEVIVVDGGSGDDTLAIAEAARCMIVTAERGRAKQLHAGVTASKGKWLLFLHADNVLAPEWVEETKRFIEAPQSRKRAAVYKLAFDDASAENKRLIFWARLRARVMKLPYGDQGLLISRLFYDGIGGYPDVPLMEDIEIIRRIGPKQLVLLETQVVTSAEKYVGDDRSAWRNLGLMARYMMGADPVELAKSYGDLLRRGQRARGSVQRRVDRSLP